MGYKALLYLNGKEIKNITSYNDLPSIQDGQDSGRTPGLVMDRDILGRIMNISVNLGITSRADGREILNILKSPNISVKFLDSETDTYKTIDCYCIDPQKELLEGLIDYYKTISFVLNSNRRYD